jgi:hypothetical protein
MRGLKSLAFILTLVGVALSAALIPAASASAGAPGLIKEIRSEFKWLEAKFVHLDQLIRDFDVKLNTMRGQILNARRLISSGNGNLGNRVLQLINAAITEKDIIIVVHFEQIIDQLIFIEEELGILLGKVEAASELAKLHPTREEKIKSLLLSVEKLVEFIQEEIFTIKDQLEDGDEGEDPEDPEDFDDVDDWLEFCTGTQLPDDQLQCSESLGRALQIIADIITEKALIFQKKKLAVKYLTEAKKLMLRTGPVVVRKTDAGFGVLGSSTVRVYSVGGQLVASRAVSGPVSLGSLTNGLANGVYYAVIGNRVEKLVVLH